MDMGCCFRGLPDGGIQPFRYPKIGSGYRGDQWRGEADRVGSERDVVGETYNKKETQSLASLSFVGTTRFELVTLCL